MGRSTYGDSIKNECCQRGMKISSPLMQQVERSLFKASFHLPQRWSLDGHRQLFKRVGRTPALPEAAIRASKLLRAALPAILVAVVPATTDSDPADADVAVGLNIAQLFHVERACAAELILF
jgi:hypothetical protein